jgi:putative nucleotidyltransferase with HDIG domain
MTEWAARLLQKYLDISAERARNALHGAALTGVVVMFIVVSTAIVAFDSLFWRESVDVLQVGSIAQQNILAPNSITYVSEVLTERSRQEAVTGIAQVYDPPDPSVARQQTQLARQILDYIRNVRRDPFGTVDQKMNDIRQITALSLDDDVIRGILELSSESWQAVDDQVVLVLERVMRESIRESDLPMVRNRLPSQVGISFSATEALIVVALVEDLIRPNTFPNPDETQKIMAAAAAAVEPVTLTFARNEIIVREGDRIDEADFEALQQLNLLRTPDNRLQQIGRAVLASVLVMVVTGLYLSQFQPWLFDKPAFLLLLTVIFLLVLIGGRVAVATGQIYLYPTAALALLFVSISSAQLSIIATLGLALLFGLLTNNSLEIATLVCAGGLIGTLVLRRTERLNNFFLAGLVTGLAGTLVVTIFNVGSISSFGSNFDLPLLVLLSMINGILAAAVAVASMYIVTLLFNLPTSLKLSDLSQPSQPLLQRLLREAPGSYQHSLQVANLSEQAALAVGANADLVRVAALYHDIGKILNPAFFTENQIFGGGNPHDVMEDPYRSADIIISHVTDGDEMAKQYRLPQRFRDFIREHHGTTQVYVFYRQAVNMAGGDESAVDIGEFTYPGPRPQSRETAIMMLADSCEAAIRSTGPTSKQQISEIIQQIVDEKMRSGQLDDSGLTLSDIKTIRGVFVDMLQAVFHPRINYRAAAERTPKTEPTLTAVPSVVAEASRQMPDKPVQRPNSASDVRATMELETTAEPENSETDLIELDDDDDKPMSEVPLLPRTGEHEAVKGDAAANGTQDTAQKESVEDEETRP